jgi:hypothetical protein
MITSVENTPRMNLNFFFIGYPLKLSVQVICSSYLFKLSVQVICPMQGDRKIPFLG